MTQNRMTRPMRLTLPRFSKRTIAQRLQLTADIKIHSTEAALRDLHARDEVWLKFFGGRIGWAASGKRWELLHDSAGIVTPLADAPEGIKLLVLPLLPGLYNTALKEKDFCRG